MHHGHSSQVAPGQTIQLINMRFPAPQAMSLFFSSSVVTASAVQPQNAFPYAAVTWGCGQAVHNAEVDLVAGSTISLFGDMMRVAVVYGSGDGPTVLASASIAPGIAEHDPPTRTLYRGSLNAGIATARLEIPPFTRRVVCYQSQQNTLLTEIDFFTTTNLAEGASKVCYAGPGNGIVNSMHVLSPDRYVRILNNSAGAVNFTLAAIIGL